MTNDYRQQIALFRYGLISPLLNDSIISQKDYLDDICSKSYDIPFVGIKQFAPKTVLGWLRIYRSAYPNGFEALKPKPRNDDGQSRSLDDDLRSKLIELRKERLHLSVSLFYNWLISQGHVLPLDFSYSTLYRFLKTNDLLTVSNVDPNERKRYAYDQINVLWQADYSHGPYLSFGGKKHKSILIAFIDDASRRITGARFMSSEKYEDLKHVLKQALLSCGKPKMLYTDNGSIYRCDNLQTTCAKLGIALIHTKPYDPKAKGKIERYFRTVKQCFLPLLEPDDLKSFEVLNAKFDLWLSKDYHHKVHSSLNRTPMDFFMSQQHNIHMFHNPKVLDEAFLSCVTRKVRSDATISLNTRFYEVPPALIGQTLDIRFDDLDPSKVFVYQDELRIATALVVNFLDNAKAKRQPSNLLLSSMNGGASHV